MKTAEEKFYDKHIYDPEYINLSSINAWQARELTKMMSAFTEEQQKEIERLEGKLQEWKKARNVFAEKAKSQSQLLKMAAETIQEFIEKRYDFESEDVRKWEQFLSKLSKHEQE